jgi:sugar/nucleoside kinase (ribokinase family)
VVAVTRGAGGAALLSESGDSSELPGQPTVVVDTVGAGDSFTATLVVRLLRKLPARDHQRFGKPRRGVRIISSWSDTLIFPTI